MEPREIEYRELVRMARRLRLVVFGGYSGLGYENPEAVASIFRRLVREAGDGTLYVGGGTRVGIGLAYRAIRSQAALFGYKGVKTAGIVSLRAKEEGMEMAEQDFLVLVPTAPGDWRVAGPSGSLMVDLAVGADGVLVYFGGGAVAREELLEAAEKGVPTVVVEGPEVRPDPGEVEKALAKDPLRTVDGTAGLRAARRWSAGMDEPILPK